MEKRQGVVTKVGTGGSAVGLYGGLRGDSDGSVLGAMQPAAADSVGAVLGVQLQELNSRVGAVLGSAQPGALASVASLMNGGSSVAASGLYGTA